MTMENGFPQRLTAIDERTRGDHWYLRRTDVCRYLGRYAPGKGLDYSATNRLILRLKMLVPGGRVELPVKEKAIAAVAAALRKALDGSVLERAVFVPVPPSKAKDDDGYDDRLVRMLRAVRPERPLDVREVILQTRSVEPSHRRAARLRPWEIVELYRIDEEVAAPEAGLVIVVDDLLTSGAHFRAAQQVLWRRFPDIDVVGLFLARREREPEKAAAVTDGAVAVPAEGEGRTQPEGGGVEGPKAGGVEGPKAGGEDCGGASGSRRAGGGTGAGARGGISGSGRRARERKYRPGVTEGDGAVKIISVINYKGGVGKTTLTANLAAELANRGKRILAVDMDAQCSLTFSFVTPDYWESELGGGDGEQDDRTIKRWFEGIVDDEGEVTALDELVLKDLKAGGHLGDKGGCLHLIPSHLGLINIDLELAYLLSGVPPTRLARRRARVFGQLRSHLNAYATDAGYDYVLIDCPPNFNIVTKNAIVASDQIVIPARPDYLSTLGIDYLLRSLRTLVEEFNADSPSVTIAPRILGVVFTMIQMMKGRPIGVQRQYMRADAVPVPIFEAMVRDNKTIFGDAPEDGIPVVLERPVPKTYGGIVWEMKKLAAEFLRRSGG